MPNPFEHFSIPADKGAEPKLSASELALCAARSFFYSLAQSPYNAIAQTVNHVAGEPVLAPAEAPAPQRPYSSGWVAQQLAGGLGSALPFLAVGALGRLGRAEAILAESKSALLGRQMLVGAVYGGLLTPVDDNGSFASAKATTALSAALAFGAMAGVSTGFDALAAGKLSCPISERLLAHGPVRSVLSGLVTGSANADLDSLLRQGRLASGERRLESALSFAMVSGAMTGGARLTDCMAAARHGRLSGADVRYVCALTRDAGRLASEMRHGVDYRTKSNANDFVSEADLKLSELITGKLKERFPKDTIISEESDPTPGYNPQGRIWLVDPIDSTFNYVKGKPGYSVMVGFLNKGKPAFGWVNDPEADVTLFGGRQMGAWQQHGGEAPERFNQAAALDQAQPLRLMMASHDLAANPEYGKLPAVQWVQQGSVGLKVGRILRQEADLLVSTGAVGKYKVWDTAGPVAIAEAAGLETRELGAGLLRYALPALDHKGPVAIGRPGATAALESRLESK